MLLSTVDWVGWSMIAIWGVIFVVTLIIELETSDLTTIWFCIASIVSLICAAFNIKPVIQVVVFIVGSIILIFVTRPLTKKMMNTEIIRTNADKVISMIGIVTKDIEVGEIGEVKVDNSTWRAVSNDNVFIAIGEKVVVNAVSGNKVVVSKINKDSNIEII